ncbi:hypothetical protein Dimus_004468 [Dionaea muscipula]
MDIEDQLMLNDDGFLEELIALGRETWEANPPSSSSTTTTTTSFLSPSTSWAALDGGFQFHEISHSSYFQEFSLSMIKPGTSTDTSTSDIYGPCFFGAKKFALEPVPEMADSILSSHSHCDDNKQGTLPFPVHDHEEDYSFTLSMMEEEADLQGEYENQYQMCSVDHFMPESSCQAMAAPLPEKTDHHPASLFSSGLEAVVQQQRQQRKTKGKKLEGQPSKNLMAERRRRKRLNDRLSMLRSVVPKITKMDRTSILGDTIDYMKELLTRINSLQEQQIEDGSSQLSVMSIFKDMKPNSCVQVKDSPQFNVERRNIDTRVEISCAGKPGLLLSTVSTLEALGLEIQQCIISCFNDFSFQASCSEELERREVVTSEEIKQALFCNAGYGGTCL